MKNLSNSSLKRASCQYINEPTFCDGSEIRCHKVLVSIEQRCRDAKHKEQVQTVLLPRIPYNKWPVSVNFSQKDEKNESDIMTQIYAI